MEEHTAEFYLGEMKGQPPLTIPERIHEVLYLTDVWNQLGQCMAIAIELFDGFDYGESVIISGSSELGHLADCVRSFAEDRIDPGRVYTGIEELPPVVPGGPTRSVVTASATGNEITEYLLRLADLAAVALEQGQNLIAAL